MTIYAKCTNPKVDWLTDGKLYEVVLERNDGFDYIHDQGRKGFCYWESEFATWTRIEDSEPPQWALDKAAKAGKRCNWRQAKSKNNRPEIASIRAHAATLAKYETEPVDPVLVKAREIVASVYGADEYASDHMPQAYIDGEHDNHNSIKAAMIALRLPAMGDDK